MLYNVIWGMHDDEANFTTRPSSRADAEERRVSRTNSASPSSSSMKAKAKKPRLSDPDESDSALSDIELGSDDADDFDGNPRDKVADSADDDSGPECGDVGDKRKRPYLSPSKPKSTSSRSKFDAVSSESKY